MMKKMLLMMLAGLLAAACEKPVLGLVEDESEISETEVVKSSKKFTFTVKGDFNTATFTRGYLAADGKDMTDLWVFDYMDGVCVQSVHQTTEDADWGAPKMSLSYGSHHVYFVASRGDGPTVDAEGHTITWTGPRDTFWKDYEVTVTNTSNGNRAVTLDRVATKLRIVVNDEVPTGCAAVVVTPERWYYGWDYVNGNAVAAQQTERRVEVPESYVGATDKLGVTIFGLSGTDEWVTNISIQAQDADGGVLGSATITGAPFKANRSTEYSGNLFGSAGGLDVSVNAAWENPETGTW
jgi:hypothetical protein